MPAQEPATRELQLAYPPPATGNSTTPRTEEVGKAAAEPPGHADDLDGLGHLVSCSVPTALLATISLVIPIAIPDMTAPDTATARRDAVDAPRNVS